jgi:hypothetical protein
MSLAAGAPAYQRRASKSATRTRPLRQSDGGRFPGGCTTAHDADARSHSGAVPTRGPAVVQARLGDPAALND